MTNAATGTMLAGQVGTDAGRVAIRPRGFDEDAITLGGVKEGTIVGTVVQQPYEWGYQGMKDMAKYLEGDKSFIPADKLIIVPTKIIDPSKVPDPARPTLICPGVSGARAWPATSLNPASGTVFVPIDPRSRGEKLAYTLRNSECRAALSVLADHVPRGSRLVLAGQPAARPRTRRRVL